jgi:hypothetical protein
MTAKRFILLLTLAAFAFDATPALAAEQAWWQLSSSTRPTYLQLGHEATIVVQATNLGDAAVNASEIPVTMTDRLPANVKATAITGYASSNYQTENSASPRGEVTCLPVPALRCSWSGPEPLQPDEQIEVIITVKVKAGAESASSEVSITGGQAYRCERVDGTGRFTSDFCKVGAPPFARAEEAEPAGTGDFEGEFGGAVPALSSKSPVIVKDGSTPFGVEDYGAALENEGGSLDTQAGSHPFQFTTALALNQTAELGEPPALAKDLRFDLPPGLIGNPTILPQCTEAEFSTLVGGNANLCPASTAVGVAVVTIEFTSSAKFNNKPTTFTVPLFNLAPAPGEPARFGFEAGTVPVLIDTAVRTGADYGIVANVHNITQAANFISEHVTFWGVPGDPRHDRSRGWSCIAGGFFSGVVLPPCTAVGETQPPPFLTLPTSCTGELQTSVQADAWDGAVSVPPLTQEPMESLAGCNGLPFSAEISVAPDVQSASTPTGLKVDVHVPQEATLNPTGVSGSDVKDITLALPEGVGIDPAGAGGLEACGEGQIGFEATSGKNKNGFEEFNPESEPGSKTPLFSPTAPEPLSPGLNLGTKGFCPNASKIGSVKITTPILAHPFEGSVYLASQNQNPFGSLVAMYIVAEEPTSGVLLKLPGEVSLNANTGQITATFLNTPQAPFEDAELHFFGGERAPLSTPAHCETVKANASIAPWSGNAPVNASSSFEIKTGPGGGACPGASLPFAPALTAGATSNQAGGFSPFTMTMSREDGNQNLKSIELHMPPGLSGILTGIPLCGEAQADAGTCPAASLLGETTVSVGLGGDPFTVKGGQVFLTGPYRNAPFGLSIVNPAVAGPYNLGKVVVRAKLEVNPTTAAVTVTSDETGAYAIPPSIDGIPLEIKHVNVTINRSGFTFNPTNCSPLAITGKLASIEGATDTLSVPFQATNCAVLKFAPKFAVTTSGKTSRANGASLAVKLTYPTGAEYANIARVKVDLPKQLPSRLTTLQKACTAAQFNANPAGCPAASFIGHAKAITPLIPVPLEGPAIFVSHGGEAFPSLIIVLQGYGVTIDLVGTTFISKAGITSTTFKTVPDQPVGSFELTLPEGKYSALAANGNLCKPTTTKTVKKKVTVRVHGHKRTETRKVKQTVAGTLQMPTEFVAQNGAVLKQTTPIGVTGCPSTRAKARPAKAKKKAKAKGKKKGGKR